MKATSVLVFMAADNNLYTQAISDLREMQQVGSSESMDVVVEIDRRKAFQFEISGSSGETMGSERLYIENGQSRTLAQLGETNTGDPEVLRAFLCWGFSQFPSQHRVLVIWNHGGGIRDTDVYARFATPMKRPLFGSPQQGMDVRWVCSDDTSRDFLDADELGKGLDCGYPLDILCFDACLMAMLEVAYQVRHSAAIMLGAQEVEPATGWAYSAVLSEISSGGEGDPVILSKKLVALHKDAYTLARQRTTLSGVLTDGLPALVNAIDCLAALLVERYAETELYLSRVLRKVQRFRDGDYVDIVHFSELCAEMIGDNDIRATARMVVSKAKEQIIANATTGTGLDNANGLSVLFPRESPSSELLQMLDNIRIATAWPHWRSLIRTYHGLV